MTAQGLGGPPPQQPGRFSRNRTWRVGGGCALAPGCCELLSLCGGMVSQRPDFKDAVKHLGVTAVE
jgi:hypothetical protein